MDKFTVISYVCAVNGTGRFGLVSLAHYLHCYCYCSVPFIYAVHIFVPDSPAQPSLSSVVAGGSVARVAVRSSRTQSDSGQEDKKGKAR